MKLQFGELPYHLVRARRLDDLFQNVLFHYRWLHAKLSSCPLQAVLSDFEDTCNNLEDRDMSRFAILKGSSTSKNKTKLNRSVLHIINYP